jgi:hypothetical protein
MTAIAQALQNQAPAGVCTQGTQGVQHLHQMLLSIAVRTGTNDRLLSSRQIGVLGAGC